MRVTTAASFVVALLATDAAAWSWQGSSGSWRWHQSGGNRVVKTITRTIIAGGQQTPAPVAPINNAPVEVPAAMPTTLVKVTTTPTAPNTETPTAAPATGGDSVSGDAQSALAAHNAARSEVGTSALVWDDALAADAASWAKHLTSVGSLTHSSGTGQGENLYMSSGRGGDQLSAASDMWIAEKSAYSGQSIGSGNFASYGHYTQAVWKSTTKVGMAQATDSSGRTYVVARYSPAGNMVGDTPY